MSALNKQEGGDHYKLAIQPIEYITKNHLSFIDGCIVKYATSATGQRMAQKI
jgi:hypothetical protein